jgi:hypothetical protein
MMIIYEKRMASSIKETKRRKSKIKKPVLLFFHH